MKQIVIGFALCALLAATPITAQHLPTPKRNKSLYDRYPKTCITALFSVAALCGAGVALWYTKPELSTFQKNLNWFLGNERGTQVGNYCAAGYGYFLGHKTQIKYAAGGFSIGLANGVLLGVFATWLYHKLLYSTKKQTLVAQAQQQGHCAQTLQMQRQYRQCQQQ